jgi:uncharacterized cupredoxin-like copper-binding protein
MPHLTRVFVVFLVVSALLGACSQAEPGSATDVKVTLTDFGVVSSSTQFSAGIPYTFTITNEGEVPHEFMFIPPVMTGMADMHGEATHSTALIEVDESQLPPGATYILSYTFPSSAAGTELEIACHTPGHYEAGMRLPITVR